MPIIRTYKPGVMPWEIGYAPENQKPYESTPVPGNVYLIKSSSGFHKIGASVDPERRLKAIRKQKAKEDITLIHLIPADDQYRAESALHYRFRSKWPNWASDWFDLSQDDVDYICTLKAYKERQFFI